MPSRFLVLLGKPARPGALGVVAAVSSGAAWQSAGGGDYRLHRIRASEDTEAVLRHVGYDVLPHSARAQHARRRPAQNASHACPAEATSTTTPTGSERVQAALGGRVLQAGESIEHPRGPLIEVLTADPRRVIRLRIRAAKPAPTALAEGKTAAIDR